MRGSKHTFQLHDDFGGICPLAFTRMPMWIPSHQFSWGKHDDAHFVRTRSGRHHLYVLYLSVLTHSVLNPARICKSLVFHICSKQWIYLPRSQYPLSRCYFSKIAWFYKVRTPERRKCVWIAPQTVYCIRLYNPDNLGTKSPTCCLYTSDTIYCLVFWTLHESTWVRRSWSSSSQCLNRRWNNTLRIGWWRRIRNLTIQ